MNQISNRAANARGTFRYLTTGVFFLATFLATFLASGTAGNARAQSSSVVPSAAIAQSERAREALRHLQVVSDERFHRVFPSPQTLPTWSGAASPDATPHNGVVAWPHPPRHSTSFSTLSATSAVSRSRQDAFDVSWYHLNLNLDGARDPELIGHVRVQGRAVQHLDTLELDLAAGMEVLTVLSTDGGSLSWARGSGDDPDKLLIVPVGGLASGASKGFDVVYRGNPKLDGSRGGYESGYRPGGDPYIWTLSEPYGAREWWPTEDHPSDKADSVRITLTIPEGMSAASNGVLLSETTHQNGTVTFDWVHRYPIATYLVSIAAGVYEHSRDIYNRPADLSAEFGHAHFPIEHFAYRNTPAVEGIGSTSGWRLTAHAMAIQERWFGPYPFALEKYGNAHVTFRGGMEHQTISSMGNIGIELIAHELAHQWYGNAVTPATWRDLWLNEGFATMGEMLTFEADPAFAPVRDILFTIYQDRAREAQGTLVLADTSDASDMFSHARVYAKGWMVLRMIRARIGDTAFRTLLRTWASLPGVQYGSGSSSAFKQVVETISGENWDRFFDQWVFEGTGEPQFSMSWDEISIEGNAAVRLRLNQIQDAASSNVEAFALRLPLWVETENRTYQILVDVDERQELIDVPLPSRPLAVHLDPEHWVLRGHTIMETGTQAESAVPFTLEVDVAPHPAEGQIQVVIRSEGARDSGRSTLVELFDMTGRRVWQSSADVSGSVSRIVIPPPSSGRYLLRVRSGWQVDEQLVIVRSR